MDSEQLNQLRTLIRLKCRAGHLDLRQGRAIFNIFDEYEAMKNDQVQSRDTQESEASNDKTKKWPSLRNSGGRKR